MKCRMKCLPLAALLLAAVLPCLCGGADSSESADPIEAFLHPGPKAHVGVWWHWMGDMVTREGIIKDLDWFRETGISSATIFGMADICTPWATKIKDSPNDGLVAFTPAWWELVRFAAEEAEKRGIELGLHNCPGYTSTGGPWITPDLAMRELVFNVTNVEAQIRLEAHADFPVFDERIQRVERPKIAARRTDYRDLGTFGGVRVGHIPMGAFVQPAQWEAFGLECDKMNPDAVAFHLDHVIADLKRYVGPQLGRGLKFILLDSYEAGTPTWTPRMREEFLARKGYDPMPLLPVLGGFQVTDEATAKRFREDFAAVRRDLFRDVLFRMMHEKLSAVGLEFACEPYTGPFDSRECAAHVDRLMTEFWFSTNLNRKVERPLDWQTWTAPDGGPHRILEAEAFTGAPENCSWTETPAQLKACGDLQFLRGINRFTLHTSPLQPWGDRVKPGATMGRWGTHFGRNQTWAKDGKAWFSYLARCQSLLQWGRPSGARLRLPKEMEKVVGQIARSSGKHTVHFLANVTDRAVETSFAALNPIALDPVSGGVCPLAVHNGQAVLKLPPCGSIFIVDAMSSSRPMEPLTSSSDAEGTPRLRGNEGTPQLLELSGTIDFPFVSVDVADLPDWTSSADERIKYFSGTATYNLTFDLPSDGGQTPSSRQRTLSLGDCSGQVAHVWLNGVDLGVAWCPPWEVSVEKGLLKEKGNRLKIDFTNVWANRLIGDEREPQDCEFVKAPPYFSGWYLKRWPKWFPDWASGTGERPSSGRQCFTPWNYFDKDSVPVPSGLRGPVTIR